MDWVVAQKFCVHNKKSGNESHEKDVKPIHASAAYLLHIRIGSLAQSAREASCQARIKRGVQTPTLFRYSRNCAHKLFNQFRRNALKNQFNKQKNRSKRCTYSILLKFFIATLRRILKRGSHQ